MRSVNLADRNDYDASIGRNCISVGDDSDAGKDAAGRTADRGAVLECFDDAKGPAMKTICRWLFPVAMLLPTTSRTAAQVPISLPQPPASSAPNWVDPAPVYHPPVYQSPAFPAPAYQVAAAQPPAVPTPSYDIPTPTPVPNAYAPSSLPGYGGTGAPAFVQPAPAAAGEMPVGTFDRQNFPPYGAPTCPPKYKAWLPTKFATPGGCGCGPCPTAVPGCAPPCCGDYCSNWYDNLALLWESGAFKGPLDLDGLNGNFGSRVGAFGAVPLSREWGLGLQAGGSAGWYDWKGSQFTGDDAREQYFFTAGVFQRFCSTGFGYAVAYDWLIDDYYSNFYFGQWRVAASWQWNPCNEIGFWGALPDRRDEAFVGTPAVRNDFSSIIQGNLYWRHVWTCAASTTLFGGLAESPSDISWGSSSQVAVNNYLMLSGGFEYILPGSGGTDGYQEEAWALSFGLSIYPGTAMRVAQSQFRPFLPMTDNGNFAIRRH